MSLASSSSSSLKAARIMMRSMRPFNYAHVGREAAVGEAADPLRIRVASYNVLAQVYSRSEYFQPFQKSQVRWKSRGPLFYSEISHFKPDLLCLQECDSFDTCWKPQLAEMGYDSLYSKRTGSKKDGCAIFYLRERFTILNHRVLNYNDIANDYPADERQDYMRNNVALVAEIRQLTDNSRFLLACTHLFWDPKLEKVKLAQAMYLKRVLTEMKAKRNCGVVVCGDFNSLPDSIVYHDMVKFGPEDALPLTSAYSQYRAEGEPEFTNYNGSSMFMGTLDYIFFSQEFDCRSVLTLPSISDAERLGPMPNDLLPSDHSLLLSELHLAASSALGSS